MKGVLAIGVFVCMVFSLLCCGPDCQSFRMIKSPDTDEALTVSEHHLDIIVSSELTSDYGLIIKAGLYWNQTTEIPFFYSFTTTGPTCPDLLAGQLIIEKSNDAPCGQTWYYVADKDILANRITISDSCLEYPSQWRETLYRHEMGHVLGLDHSKCDGDLMSPELDVNIELPLDAQPEVIDGLINIYCKERGWCKG